MTLREVLDSAGGISSQVNATLFFGWLGRNSHSENDDNIVELAREFIEEYKQ